MDDQAMVNLLQHPEALDDWVQLRLPAVLMDGVYARPAQNLRRAAVLIPLLRTDGQWSLLFTRRTDTVINHKGQVSFPGGAREAVDQTDEETALREAQEEIGLDPACVKVLGKLEPFETISRYEIIPIVARLDWPVRLTLSPQEVNRVFTIPVGWLGDCRNWSEVAYNHHRVIQYERYDGELLWGITASITQQFLRKMGWMGC